jgi:cyclophilin family peptidyl-prolyl cis-trans isomerase
MSSGNNGPGNEPRRNQPNRGAPRGGPSPSSARSSGQSPRGPRPPQNRGGRQAEARRRAAQQAARQRRLVAFTIGGVVILVAIIAAVVAIVNSNNSSSSASATVTPAATAVAQAAATVAPAGTAQPIPIAPLIASAPSAAEVAASKKACGPFLTAGQKPQGNKQWGSPPKQVIDKSKHYQVKLYTDKGTITANMLTTLAPITTNNFIFLSCNGFYDNVVFHRTVPDFMIQGGDPLGTGTGGPGYTIPDEKVARAYQVGDFAMANTGQPNSGGSQFFIIQGSQGVALPPSYSLFGHVTSGMNVVDAIVNAPAHSAANSPDNTPSSPNNPVHIRTVTVQVS